MANQKIFCNTPWYELHVYWDGSLGICCYEDHKLYSAGNYNIASMSIVEWFNSDPVKNFRQRILKDSPLSECRRCYREEQLGGDSKRLRGNLKSAIYTKQAFEDSFEQSPGRVHFVPSGVTKTVPIDLHIDLGNHCNLACKMCNAQASSTIASREVMWGVESSRQYLTNDWTRNTEVWNSFKQQLNNLPGLNNIHLMGGETVLSPRFEDLLDHLIATKNTHVGLSFVTNGTVFKPNILEKLIQFDRVGIEISVETVTPHNAYQRMGTDTELVLTNISKYLEYAKKSNISVSIRPAISVLSIGHYHTLIEYAWQNRLVIQSLLVQTPRFMSAEILPQEVKHQYLESYKNISARFESKQNQDYNSRDQTQLSAILNDQVNMCIGMLSTPTPDDAEYQLQKLVKHCKQWDHVYGYDARKLYPELSMIWDRYGY